MGTGTEGEFRKKGIKNVGDRRREWKRNWTAGGAEDAPRTATVPRIIGNCFTYRHYSMFATYAVMCGYV